MSRKKKITIIAVIIAIFLLSTFIFLTVRDLNEEKKFKEEIKEILELLNLDISTETLKELDERLSKKVAKYDYKDLEKYTKWYLKRLYRAILPIAEVLNNEYVANALTVKNYQTDGPNFPRTKTSLREAISVLQEEKENYLELFTEEKIMSFVENKGLNKYYLEFYKKEFILTEDEILQVTENYNNKISSLETTLQIITFLDQNRYGWKIVNNNIQFSNNALQNQYNTLLDKIEEYK